MVFYDAVATFGTFNLSTRTKATRNHELEWTPTPRAQLRPLHKVEMNSRRTLIDRGFMAEECQEGGWGHRGL